MADASKLPLLTVLKYFYWGLPATPNPTLAAAIDSDDSTLTFSVAPKDEDGTIIDGGFLLGVRNEDGFVETIYIAAGNLSADGLTATSVVRGIDPAGLDYTVGNASFADSFASGDSIFCVIHPTIQNILVDALQGVGDMATGGDSFVLGDGTDANVTIKWAKSGSVVGWLRVNQSTSKIQFQNPGGAWTNIDDVSASNLVLVSADDTTAGYLNGKIIAGTNTTLTEGSPGANETLAINAAGTLASIVTDVSTTEAEIDQALDGISANVTFTNLNTLTAGAASNADALHTHASSSRSYYAYESITAADGVVSRPVEVERYSSITDADLAIGSANTTRRRAIRFVPSATNTSLATMKIYGKEEGSSTVTLTVSIQPDSAGVPSGTAIANGTANTLDTSGWTATYAERTITWASPPTLTAGTTYWLVIAADKSDGTNYVKISSNSSHDEDYLPLQMKTYDLDTTSWDAGVTNNSFFFWGLSPLSPFGVGVMQCDASFAGRTWGFAGFAATTVSALASVAVAFTTATGLSGLAPGKDHYVSTTAGAVTPVAPNGSFGNDWSYKIGVALSATEMLIQPGIKHVIGNGNQASSASARNELIPLFFAAKSFRISGSELDSTNDDKWVQGTGLTSIGMGSATLSQSGQVTFSGGNPSVMSSQASATDLLTLFDAALNAVDLDDGGIFYTVTAQTAGHTLYYEWEAIA